MAQQQRLNRGLLAVAAVLALLGTACSGSQSISEAIAADQLTELDGVEALRTRFNADTGTPRLLLLLSPT